MPGTTVLYGFGPSRIEKGYYTGLNINSTAASRTAITTGMGTGQNVGYLGVGDVLVRDPNGQDQGLGRDFTQPQTSYLYEQAVVVVELLNPKTMGSQTFKDGSGTQYYPQEFNYIELNPDISALTKANMTAGTTVLGLANASSALQAVSGMTLTDSTTGTAGATLAAGVGYQWHTFPFTFITSTSAIDVATNLVLGYKFKIVKWSWIDGGTALVGASGSRVANMEIGTTDVGTVVSTCTVTQSGTAQGRKIDGTTVTGANTGSATDTFSIEIASGGTDITAGNGAFHVLFQNMDTADAVASLAANIGLQQRIKALALETANTGSTAALKRVKFGGPFQHNSA